MAGLAAVVLLALVLENDDLLALALADHFARHGGAFDEGGAHFDALARGFGGKGHRG